MVEDEVRIMSDNQDNDNVHLYVPNLKNYDGLGGRRKSEMMVTSSGSDSRLERKIFEDIEVPNPTENADAVTKRVMLIEKFQNIELRTVTCLSQKKW